jgi:hypothetical protein
VIASFLNQAVEPIAAFADHGDAWPSEWNGELRRIRNLAFIRNRKVGPDVVHLNE